MCLFRALSSWKPIDEMFGFSDNGALYPGHWNAGQVNAEKCGKVGNNDVAVSNNKTDIDGQTFNYNIGVQNKYWVWWINAVYVYVLFIDN